MLVRIKHAAAREIEHPPLGGGVGRSLATMKGLRRREIDAAPAALACARREVHVLEVDEEALVEPAERLEHAAANQEKCPHDLIDGARVVMRPFGHKVRWENRRQQPVEPNAVADHGERSGPPRGVARKHPAGIEELNADDPYARMLRCLQVVRGPFERARHEPRVGVEEQQKVRVRPSRTLVARGRKTAVIRIPDHMEGRRAGEPVRGAVGRGVVDDRHARDRHVVFRNRCERGKAFLQLSPGIPVHDHDMDCRATH